MRRLAPPALALVALLGLGACFDVDDDAPSRQTCGNGELDAGEACDGTVPGTNVEFCDASCMRITCGDGVADEGEPCDPAIALDAPTCTPDCTRTICGDGRLEAPETCDLGPTNGRPGSSCDAACRISSCGDGELDAAEACDEGPRNDPLYGTCDWSCAPTSCGDGAIGVGESCDPGRSDDCPSDCRRACRAVSIAAGWYTTFVVTGEGELFGAGYAPHGPISGDPTIDHRPSPMRIEGLPPVDRVVAGAYFAAALDRDGQLWSWGTTHHGAVGRGAFAAGTVTPALVPVAPASVGEEPPRFRSIAASGATLFAIDRTGRLWGTGRNGPWALLQDRPTQGEPLVQDCVAFGSVAAGGRCLAELRVIDDLRDYLELSAANETVLARFADGSVRGWGDDSMGNLASAAAIEPDACAGATIAGRFFATPWRIETGATLRLAATRYTSIFLGADQLLRTTGGNCALLRGPSSVPSSATVLPRPLAGLADAETIVALGAGTHHLLLVTSAGRLFAGGMNSAGESGVAAPDGSDVPVELAPVAFDFPTAVVEAAAGARHSVVRLDDGTVWAFGSDYEGQLGDGADAATIHVADPVPARIVLPCE